MPRRTPLPARLARRGPRVAPEPGPVDLPGPWEHRYVAAGGARFHVAVSAPVTGDPSGAPVVAADQPTVVLLHGFPHFWWAWRHQLPVLAAAGWRAVAMDLRGYGGSDKTPRGYDPRTLAGDVVGVVRALGGSRAALVGHGWGGYVAWATAALHPERVRGVATLAAPHPASLPGTLPSRQGRRALAHVLRMQVPVLPERRLSDPRHGMLGQHLHDWSAPGSAYPDQETLATYQAALSLWPAPHCALEYHRWLLRSRLRADGQDLRRALRRPVDVPVLEVYGERDPAVAVPLRRLRRLRGPHQRVVVAGAGHFLPEEAPEQVSRLLTSWLPTLG